VISWSPDGRWLAGALSTFEGKMSPGIAVYSPATGRLERLTGRGRGARWLRDGRSLLTRDGDSILGVDLETRKVHEILNAPPNSVFQDFALDADSHALYVVRRMNEGDVWMLTLDGATGKDGL
jgi:Tol biopolymer transport system component